jgi:Transglutaminase-like superfamily
MAIPAQVPRPALRDAVTAFAALITASAVLRLAPLRLTLALARAGRACTRRPSTTGEAERAIAAHEWVARYFPGRAACLERSFAIFLASCSRGHRVDWCTRHHPHLSAKDSYAHDHS